MKNIYKYYIQSKYPNNITKKYIDSLKIKELEELYIKAKWYYYNTATTLMEDLIFDYLEEKIKKLNSKSKVLKDIGAPVESKSKLPFFLGSLNKKKEDTIDDWLNKQNSNTYCVSDKIDGISVLLYIKNGQIYQAWTRGDGKFGKNISLLIKDIKNIKQIEKGLFGTFYVRGELIMNKSEFNFLYKQEFKNARNLVSGIFNTKGKHKALKSVMLVVYELVESNKEQSEQLRFLKDKGFDIINYTLLNKNEINSSFLNNYLNSRKQASEYSMDGLVISSDKVLKTNDKNPKGIVAYKPNDITNNAVATTVKNVEWNISEKLKVYKPVVIFEPINIDNVIIKRASGYNARWIKKNGIGKGASILVERSGNVIPKIIKVIKSVKPEFPIKYKWRDNVDIEPI